MRRPPGPGTRAQHTTSALPISSAATRSMISGSSVSTCIALASPVVLWRRPPAGAAGNGESNPRAPSTRNGPCPASSRWQGSGAIKVGDRRVGGAGVDLVGAVERDRLVRAEGVVVDPVGLGVVGQGDRVVDVFPVEPLVLNRPGSGRGSDLARRLRPC